MSVGPFQGAGTIDLSPVLDVSSGRNLKESTGKQVELVWAYAVKRGALRRKEGDGNRSTREKEVRMFRQCDG